MKLFVLLLIGFSMCGELWASRPEIDSTAYAKWKRIDNYAISDNGLWVKYRYAYIDNEEEDRKVRECYYICNTRTGKTRTIEHAEMPEFFAGGNWISYTDGRDSEKPVTYLMELQNERKIQWNRAEDPECLPDVPIVNYQKKGGSRVFLRLNRPDSVVYYNIGCYELSDAAKKILYIRKSETANELCYGDLFTPESHRVIFRDTSRSLNRFNFSKNKGTFELHHEKTNPGRVQWYTFELTGKTGLLADSHTWQLPEGITSAPRNIRLLGNGTLFEFDAIPHQKTIQKPQSDVQCDSSFTLELWSWQDPVIQSVQALSGYRKEQEKLDKYLYDNRTGTIRQISDGQYASIRYQPGNIPHYALLTDNSAFQLQKDWLYIERKDYKLVNLQTGKQHILARSQTQQAEWSPDGRYIIYFDDQSQAWKRFEPERLKTENISEAISFPVHNELCDRPHPAEPYGIGGWSADGTRMYLYDRFDIWRVDMDNLQAPYCITQGIGRRDSLILRLLDIYSIAPLRLDETKPFYLDITEWKTRNSGIGQMNGSKLQKDYFGAFMYQCGGGSQDGKTLLLSRQSFSEGRNLWVYNLESHRSQKISDANPGHCGYQWGSVRMTEWTNGAGKRNQGLVYLPHGYNPSQTYPVIVNYYETHAQEMHTYQVPGWSCAMLDISTYLSQGYVIFRPDVYFTVGEPGQSTYDAVVSGVEHLIKQGIANPDRIGIEGHSWSGCTAALLITMTDIFRCASIGAGVVNLTEAYTALRTGSGNTRMFMYEDWQCRMGKNLWENLDAYVRNSAILRANRITAPVLIMHNDKDEAVEFHEGRNLFLALRRLQHPAWLLNYKNEGHFIGNKNAQRDWSQRMMQFFNHYLKNAPMPRWMQEGININERGFDQKYDFIK